ncbi:hypothetical protein NKG94_05875 [Micromonospora sp. M12]
MGWPSPEGEDGARFSGDDHALGLSGSSLCQCSTVSRVLAARRGPAPRKGDGRARPGSTVPPDEMSAGATDVLLVAVGSGGAAMVLVQAIAGWLTHRREDVTVKLTRPDGWSAELDVRRARDMDQVTALIEAAVRALADHEPSVETNDR